MLWLIELGRPERLADPRSDIHMALDFLQIRGNRYSQPMGLIARRVMNDVLILNPPFQHGLVWSHQQRVAFIESILDGLPLPALFINEMPYNHPRYPSQEVVVDGQQRINAVVDFMQDKFRVRGELWSEQDKTFKRVFCITEGTCTSITTRYNTLRELYVRLLTTGTIHTQDEINDAKDLVDQLQD